ncbi:MAG: glutaredoxin domain-containing protein [Nanoarchaeota archaeon]
MKTQKSNKESPKVKQTEIKIYTTNTCPWCMKAKEFFKQHNIGYQEIKVGVNEQARNEMFEKSGQFGVPVIDIDGEIIVGFNTHALKKALQI